MALRTGWCAVAALALSSTLAGAQDTPARDDSRYLYELNRQNAADCAVMQLIWANDLGESDPEAARQHTAMAFTWWTLAEELTGEEVTQELLDAHWAALIADVDQDGALIPFLEQQAQKCEVISNIHNAAYRDAAERTGNTNAEVFADNAAMQVQTGTEYPEETPRKEIMFDGNWAFFSRGNSCQASPLTLEGMTLVFGFTNFFDGAITLESDSFPTLDAESDDYEEAMEAHREGLVYDEELGTYVDYDYDSFPGTGLFIDDYLIGGPYGSGTSDGQRYVFGAYTQGDYYNLLPQGRELRLKVLGEEVRRIPLPGPAFWNEMSNCMAQYPYG